MYFKNIVFIYIYSIFCEQTSNVNTFDESNLSSEKSKNNSSSPRNSKKYDFADIVDQYRKKKQEEIDEIGYDMDKVFKKCTNYKKREYLDCEDSISGQ